MPYERRQAKTGRQRTIFTSLRAGEAVVGEPHNPFGTRSCSMRCGPKRAGILLGSMCRDKQSRGTPSSHSISPEELSQRHAVRVLEDVYGKTFAVTEVPDEALEGRWRSAEDPFEKTFYALMLGVARRLDSGIQPPYESFPMEMGTVRDFVRRGAQG